MQAEKLNDNCTFAYVPDLEPIWGVINLLTGSEKSLAPCVEIYGSEKIAGWRKKYHFLFECLVENEWAVNMMDFLLDLPIEHVSLANYRDALLDMPAEDFVWRILDLHRHEDANRGDVTLAISDNAALDRVFSWIADDHNSFLSFSALVRQSDRLITEFFSLAEELRSPELLAVLDSQTDKVSHIFRTVRDGTADTDPLVFSQKMLGKTFHNRGPYMEYVFLPSYLMPHRCVRYFHVSGDAKRQLLFLSLHDTSRRREDTIRTLKAVADGTRYQILTLLAAEGPLRGLDIARKVSIATSTVSHHMEQLKEGGLITEEQVKSAKYYGLDRKNAAALLNELKKDLSLE